MSNQSDHTIVRLRVPPELKKQIEESAEKNNRSQSAEMVARLEQSFDTPENTRTLLEDAVKLTIQAIKEDPSLLNNAKISTVYIPDNESKKDTVEFINKIKAP